jgi:hypothetical protein
MAQYALHKYYSTYKEFGIYKAGSGATSPTI